MILRFPTVTHHPTGRQQLCAARFRGRIARMDAGNGVLRVVTYCR